MYVVNITDASINISFFGRVLHVSKVVFVFRAWGDPSHTRELLLGRCWMKKRMLIVFALCLWTGLLF